MSEEIVKEDKISTGYEPEQVTDSWFWIKDTKGYGSVTVTFVTIAFIVTTAVYILSIFEKIGPVTFREFDVAACSVYYVPLLATYMGRKYTEAKFDTSDK